MTAKYRFACQTYSWQMSFDRYVGQLDHMASVAAASGFTGLEPEIIMLGDTWSSETITSALGSQGLSLAALTLVCLWENDNETAEERLLADRAIRTVRGIPGAILNLVQFPGMDRRNLEDRQRRALQCLASIGRRARVAGVTTSFHPNSPRGSLFRVQSDYDRLLTELDPTVGFTPDVGHIAAGGMDPVAMIREHMHRVCHVHIKDIRSDGSWAETGRGMLDIAAILDALDRGLYTGWIAFEDESDLARSDPDQAVRAAGSYIHTTLRSRTQGREDTA